MYINTVSRVLMTFLTTVCVVTNAAPSPASESPAATCTQSSYPAFVTDTTNQQNAFYLTVNSNNAAHNGHNVQLRPDPSTPGATLVVVDSTSPVLALQMRGGSLYSQAMDALQDLGPVGGFRNITTNPKTSYSKQALIFRDLQGAGPAFKQSQGGFQLVGGGDAATYNLYHEAPLDVANGFIICEMTSQSDTYYQLFYQYYQNPPTIAGCEYIAVQVSPLHFVNFAFPPSLASFVPSTSFGQVLK